MKSQTVSIRIPIDEIEEIDRIADQLAVDRPMVIKRLISVGVEGLVVFEKSGELKNWPRKGQMSLSVTPQDMVFSEDDYNSTLKQIENELPPQ